MDLYRRTQSGFTRSTWILGLAAVLAGVGAALSLGGHGPDHTTSNSAETELAQVQDGLANAHVLPADFRTIPEFSLINQDSEAVDRSLFLGQWSMVFFGFTHCPDVCPASLIAMQGFMSELAQRNTEAPQVVFVSIDPKRDTPELLKPYLNYFDERIVGVTGDFTAIDALRKKLGIVAEFTANPEIPNSYTISHTASIFMVDPQGRIRGKFDMPHEPATMADDFSRLRAALAEPA